MISRQLECLSTNSEWVYLDFIFVDFTGSVGLNHLLLFHVISTAVCLLKSHLLTFLLSITVLRHLSSIMNKN